MSRPARTVSLGCRLNTYEAERMGVLAGEAGEGDAALARKLIERVWALNEAIGIPRTTDKIQAADVEELDV